LPLYDVPAVRGVLTPAQCRQTAQSIAATQESSGAIPWFDGGHTDPWDHIESAMALTAAGLLDQARGGFDWCRTAQRADGSWPIQLRNGVIEDANSDSNFCAYIATGVWHHVLVTGDRRFAESMWPVVAKAIDFVVELQFRSGEISWATSPSGPEPEALLTGNSSIYHSIRCALALADYVDDPQPEWEVAVGQLGHAIARHPEGFVSKDRWSMEWYYPVLGGALRGAVARVVRRSRCGIRVVQGNRAGLGSESTAAHVVRVGPLSAARQRPKVVVRHVGVKRCLDSLVFSIA